MMDDVKADPVNRTGAYPLIRVIEKHRKRRGKGNSSRGTRRLTEIDRRASKAIRRVTRAFNHGMDTYIEERDESRSKRKDGPVVDFVENVSYGVSTTLS